MKSHWRRFAEIIDVNPIKGSWKRRVALRLAEDTNSTTGPWDRHITLDDGQLVNTGPWIRRVVEVVPNIKGSWIKRLVLLQG